MVKVPQKTDSSNASTKELCKEKFKEWWTKEELSEIISKINPSILRLFSEDSGKIQNPDKLSEILYDIVGTRFLRNIENDINKRKQFLGLILHTVIDKNFVNEKDIIDIAKDVFPNKRSSIRTLSNVIDLDASGKWCLRLARELNLPTSVAEKEKVESLQDTEVIEPHSPLNPLYDYQYSTGLFIREMLEGKNLDEDGKEVKRKLIAVPTGAGKTRMVVETLIEWLNDDKPSKNEQQNKSKFILWIAQSSELCEQAFGTFRDVFESQGRRGTTLRLHRFWGSGGTLPKLGMDDLLDEKGVIIATIQSLHKIHKNQSNQLENLSKLTSCIIIDEAHHSVADSYSQVLRTMGFNFDLRKQEISTLGIILIGLTATPFRGTGDNIETDRLKRWYDGIYFPSIPYAEGTENFSPHALIDCQTFAYVGESIRILGEKSYDRDGYIKEEDYSWTITKVKRFVDIYSKNVKHHDEWTFEKTKNITFTFPEPGEYKITLTVVDNEGETNTNTAYIKLKAKEDEQEVPPDKKQKQLYHKLIKRKVLCEVYHKILQSKCIELSSHDADYMEQFGEFRKETLKHIGTDPARNKIILDEIHKIKTQYQRKKILFFGCGVEHSRQIAMALKILYGMNVRYVDSKMDIDSRVNAIEQFRNGPVEVLCNFDVLTTGFDAPNVDCVFIGRPAKSTLLYTQMIGRGMRGTKSGGTEDLLLVDIDDNFQLADKYHDPSKITELGWKLFSEYWKKWVEPYDTKQKLGKIEPVIHDQPQLVQYLPCTECGETAEGIEQIQKIFGIEGPTQILIEYLKEKKFELLPTKCVICRTEVKEQPVPIETTSQQDPYITYLANQTNIQGTYQMVLGLYALSSQERNLNEQYKANMNDALEFLRKHNPDKSSSQITASHPVFTVYKSRGLIKSINETTGEIDFEHITDTDGFRRLCNQKIQEYLLKEDHHYEEPIKPIVEEYSSEKIDEHFNYLKDKIYGHTPTTKQFFKSSSPDILITMEHLYGPYQKYLESKGVSIKDDANLQDKLYDEYFELYDLVKSSINKEMLDEYGEYRIDDYVECFGTYENFEKITDEIIARANKLDPSITYDDLYHDYTRIIEDLGREPHFEEMKLMSYLGIEYYIGKFATYGRFTKIAKLKGDSRKVMQSLQQDFFKIKRLLKMPPNYRQMRQYSEFGHKLEELYNGNENDISESDYHRFLNDIGEFGTTLKDPIPDSFKKQKRTDLLESFQDSVLKNEKEKTMDLFLDAESIPYVEWFGSKDGFISELRKIDSSYPTIYKNRQDARLPENKEKPEQKKSLQEKIERISKSDTCPKCNSALVSHGKLSMSCSNFHCNFSKYKTCPKCDSELIRDTSGLICTQCDYYEFIR